MLVFQALYVPRTGQHLNSMHAQDVPVSCAALLAGHPVCAAADSGVLPKQRVSTMCAVIGQYLWSHSLLGHLTAELFVEMCKPLATLVCAALLNPCELSASAAMAEQVPSLCQCGL
jgi:hypothetical protein